MLNYYQTETCLYYDGGCLLDYLLHHLTRWSSSYVAVRTWNLAYLYSAYNDREERSFELPSPGRNCMTHHQVLAAASTTIIRTQCNCVWHNSKYWSLQVWIWFGILLNSMLTFIWPSIVMKHGFICTQTFPNKINQYWSLVKKQWIHEAPLHDAELSMCAQRMLNKLLGPYSMQKQLILIGMWD
jgi:hypothetical protein